MTYENTHRSMILLLDGNPPADNRFIKRWLKKSRFVTCEATDVFDALEEISDFTVRKRPDVILLEVGSMRDDFQIVKRLTRELSEEDSPPVFAFSDSKKVLGDGECFNGSLAKLEARLDNLIPVYKEARRTIAA